MVIMTSKEWVDRLQTLASWHSLYSNKYPLNLLYYNNNGYYTADCVNLLKALFNGRDIYNKTVGSFQRDLSNTGDCTEWGLLNQCTDISQDFDKLDDKPRVLYMSGHIGTYLGKEVTIDGTVRNVIECTPIWEDGIIYSYVDRYGNRFHHKGDIIAKSWTHHGLATKWVSYDEEKPFTDVDYNTTGGKAIMWCYDNGIVKGYKDGTFKPENFLTREQMCIMLERALNK